MCIQLKTNFGMEAGRARQKTGLAKEFCLELKKTLETRGEMTKSWSYILTSIMDAYMKSSDSCDVWGLFLDILEVIVDNAKDCLGSSLLA